MSDSAITNFKILLKDIADQLSEDNVKDMVWLLELPKSARINSGVALFQEMTDQDLLDEENLDNLKKALKHVNQAKLLKKVKAFEESKKPVEREVRQAEPDKLSQSWPSSRFSQQPQRPHNSTLPGSSHDIPRPQYEQGNYLYPQGGAPPGNNQGYPYPAYQHAPQQYPGVGYPMQGHQQLGPRRMHYQGGYQNPHDTMAMHYSNQGIPQYQLPGNPQMTQSPFPPVHQFTGNPAAPNHTQLQYSSVTGAQNPDPRSRIQSYPQPSQIPPPQGATGHAKLTPVKSAPPGTESADHVCRASLVPEPEVGLKKSPTASTTEPEQNDASTKILNIPPSNKDEEVAKATKVTKQQTENGNIIGHTSSITAHSSSNAGDRVVNSHADDVYQTGRVRAESVEDNNADSIAVATHPMSSLRISDPVLERLSTFVGKRLHDYRKVDRFASQNGSYQVSIPEGEHFSTSEGKFVFLNFGSDYSIRLCSLDEGRRCSALVRYDGNVAGDWTLDPNQSITIERSAFEDQKFHFVEESRAPLGSGVRQGNPYNGVVEVEFTPERRQEAEVWNDLKRGFGVVGSEQESDYFGDDDDASGDSDISRSCWPATLQSGCAGATILHGRSLQQFTQSEHFQLDEHGKQVIVLKLLGK